MSQYKGLMDAGLMPASPQMTADAQLAIRFDNKSAGGSLPEGRKVHEELRKMELSATGLQLLVGATQKRLENVHIELSMQEVAKCAVLQRKIQLSIKTIIKQRAEHADALCKQQRELTEALSSLEEYMERHRAALGESFIGYIKHQVMKVKSLLVEIKKCLEDLEPELEKAVNHCRW